MAKARIDDAGSNLVITAAELEAVQSAIAELVAQGARSLGEPARVGAKWIASCGKPPAAGDAAPRTLQAEFEAAAALQGVKVTRAGTQLTLSAADATICANALRFYVKRGARVVANVTWNGEQFVARCDERDPPGGSCKVERLGYQIVITGESEQAVRDQIQALAIGGIKLMGPIDRIGENWVAVCDTRA
jgi:hypothetical protein